MPKSRKIEVKGVTIAVTERDKEDFISLSDIANGFEGGTGLIEKWIRNKNTIEFLAVWETLNNASFNEIEHKNITDNSGSNTFLMSAKKWIEQTNAIGISASAGRYGGTYARIEIALEFAIWLNPRFKMQLISQILDNKSKSYETLFKGVFDFTDTEMNESPYYLYLMQDLSNKFYKIGISKSPVYREKTLQSEKPNILMLNCTIFTSRIEAYNKEKELHKKYNHYRIRGEWFNFSSLELQEIEKYFNILDS